jgi:hypothetical protein
MKKIKPKVKGIEAWAIKRKNPDGIAFVEMEHYTAKVKLGDCILYPLRPESKYELIKVLITPIKK